MEEEKGCGVRLFSKGVRNARACAFISRRNVYLLHEHTYSVFSKGMEQVGIIVSTIRLPLANSVSEDTET